MKTEFFIQDSATFVGKVVTVNGWVFNKRPSGGLVFLHVRDGSGFLQATAVKSEVSAELFESITSLPLESSVSVTGLLKAEPRAPGGYEIAIKKLEVIQSPKEEFPIGKKEHGPDFLLSHRHLWIRSKRQWAILRIRTYIMQAIMESLHEQHFLRFDAPIITPSACEGTTTLFEIDYFGEPAYLTQSGQLYLEAAIASFGRVYDFGPIMRAEKSKTRRHLTEFWMMDAEAAFVEFSQNIDIQEKLIKYVVAYVLEHGKTELALIDRDITPLQKVVDKPFVRLTYGEAIKKLKELGSDIQEGTDFGNDDETILMTHYDMPVFVTHFPSSFKAFYFKKSPGDPSHVLAADLLAPEGYGEVIGGGQREDDYDTLVKRIKEHGYEEKDYDWYLDLRKYGSVPHSGFGVGLERLVAWICKLEHVRETIPFPRMLERFKP
jgi:asparaginyl-tRNA synthetase